MNHVSESVEVTLHFEDGTSRRSTLASGLREGEQITVRDEEMVVWRIERPAGAAMQVWVGRDGSAFDAEAHRSRYLVRAGGGLEIRSFEEPLEVGQILTDIYGSYRVAQVDQPRNPGGLGRAWCKVVR